MKLNSKSIKNILFFIVILLLIVPQTRLPIQVFFNKGLAQFSPSIEGENGRDKLSNHNWELKSTDGSLFNLNSTKGKITIINFWATWCPPCIAEMPSLQALHNAYEDKVEFVLVSSEKNEVVNSFLEKKGYNFKSYFPLGMPPETFKVSSIPRTFLIDQSGRIVIDKTGAANWNSDTVRRTLDDLLAKN